MRTTVDMPEAALKRAKAIAQARGITLGALLAEMVMEPPRSPASSGVLGVGPAGFPSFCGVRVVTLEDVNEHDRD
jgi:hypothetical protein